MKTTTAQTRPSAHRPVASKPAGVAKKTAGKREEIKAPAGWKAAPTGNIAAALRKQLSTPEGHKKFETLLKAHANQDLKPGNQYVTDPFVDRKPMKWALVNEAHGDSNMTVQVKGNQLSITAESAEVTGLAEIKGTTPAALATAIREASIDLVSR